MFSPQFSDKIKHTMTNRPLRILERLTLVIGGATLGCFAFYYNSNNLKRPPGVPRGIREVVREIQEPVPALPVPYGYPGKEKIFFFYSSKVFFFFFKGELIFVPLQVQLVMHLRDTLI